MAPFYKLSLYRQRKLQCSNKWISKDRKSETSLYSYRGEKLNRDGFKKRGKTAATNELGRLKLTLGVFQSPPIDLWICTNFWVNI